MAVAARAQQAGKLPTIGYLGANTASAQSQWTAAFVQRLRELGWIEGRTVAIEYRWGEGRSERMAEIATEFVRLKVDIIFTGGTAAVIAAKQATSVIPIVFAAAGDPVGNNLVASLPRPAATSPACQTSRPILLASESNSCARLSPVSAGSLSWPMSAVPSACWRCARFRQRPARLALTSLRRKSNERRISRPPSMRSRAVSMHFMSGTRRSRTRTGFELNTLALSARLPTMHGIREQVEAGGLMSYGSNFPDLFRRTADFVDKILRGAKPGDIPVEQPTKFDLIINLTTAKALGLAIPESFLLRADEVIE